MKPGRLTTLAILLLACPILHGQDFSAGVFNSVKGIGLSAEFLHSNRLDMIETYADLYGVIGGRCDTPGVKLCYTHARILKQIVGDSTSYLIYLGPGFSTGYIQDFEAGMFEKSFRTFVRNKGICAALTAKGGVRMDFNRRLSLNAGIRIEAGVHVRPDEQRRAYALSLYENGIYQTYVPELSILYRF